MLIITGCGKQPKTNAPDNFQHFGPLPSNPSSIVVTRYLANQGSVKKGSKSYTLTGTRMTNLYQSLKQASKHVIPNPFNSKCPNYEAGTILWDYHIVVHYPNHKVRSFTQKTVACTFVQDNKSYARSFGPLPELSPLGTIK